MRHQSLSSRFAWLLAATFSLLSFTLASDAASLDQIRNDLERIADNKEKLEYLQTSSADLLTFSDRDQAEFWYLLGLAQTAAGKAVAGEESFTRSINLLSAPDVPVSRQLALSLKARSVNSRMRTFDPEIYCGDRKQAVDVARQLDDPPFLAEAIAFYVYCYIDRPDAILEAFELLEEANEIANQFELSVAERATIYNASGFTYYAFNAYDKAYEYYLKSYDLRTLDDDPENMTSMQANLVTSAVSQVEFELARQHVAQLFEIAASYPEYPNSLFYAHYFSGFLAKAQSNWDAAAQSFENAIEVGIDTQYLQSAHELLVVCLFRAGRVAASREAYLAIFDQFPEYAGSAASFKWEINAVAAFHNGDSTSAINNLFSGLDKEILDKRRFIKQSTVSAALAHSANVVQLENRILQQDLSLNRIRLDQEERESRLFKITLAFVTLLVVALVWLSYLLLMGRREFQAKSQTDYLTKISNRRYFHDKGSRLLANDRQRGATTSMILFDVDDFKQVNDTYGHEVGDVVLKSIVDQCVKCVGPGGLMARLGGDEFVVLSPDTNQEQIMEIGETIRRSIKRLRVDQLQQRLSVSMGVVATDSLESIEDLVSRADKALYKAKLNGKDQLAFLE